MAQRAPTELSWYLNQIKATPLLTAKQEKQLAWQIREHSDILAREQMIQANLRLVVKIAAEYTKTGMPLTDLVSEGNLGLVRAVEQFDPDAGVRFSTYAAWWIKQSIKQALNSVAKPIAVPDYLAKLIVKWRRARQMLAAEFGRDPTHEEIAQRMGLSAKKAAIVEEGLRAVSTPAPVDHEDDDGNSDEALADTTSPAPDQAMMDASIGPWVEKLLHQLPDRMRTILELRFGLDGHTGPQRTYKEVGKLVGLTRERVRQLEHQALKQLRETSETL
ncbi:MAG: sigma-70 family RNA polymerase sigma factor [Planctomycetota bacterium]|jgi:RNA polymerase primary sigma factor